MKRGGTRAQRKKKRGDVYGPGFLNQLRTSQTGTEDEKTGLHTKEAQKKSQETKGKNLGERSIIMLWQNSRDDDSDPMYSRRTTGERGRHETSDHHIEKQPNNE